MKDKIKDAAIEFLAEIEAQIRGWDDEPDSEEKQHRVSELKCILNCCGAMGLREAIGKVAVRRAKKRAADWWNDMAAV
jgi:hypothetical protein